MSKTLCHHLSPFPSVPPEVTPQGVSVTPAPTSKPLPLTPELPGPGSVTHAGKALEEITSSPKEDSHPSVFTSHPQVPFQNAPDQVIDEITGNFSKAVLGLRTHNKLQKACEILEGLAAFIPGFSESAQVRVINTLTDLNEQLLQSPLLNSNNPGSRTPVTVCLFHSLNNVMKAGEASRPRHGHSVEQVENMLKMSLLSLGRIQETFLQQNRCAEPEVTLTSSTAALMLSRQNISTLPLSSYTLGDPAPVRLGFPSASALEELLKKHPGVDVQVTGLAFNPFRDFDKKKIVGSVGSVLLSSNHKLLQVHDLMEDIEIMLWRNASMETHPTSLNMSTDHFTITVNVTSLEKSLIVCVEPEGPLSLTLYLGFQHQPNHTHFRLPKERVSQKDEEYTWVLRPEKLRYGVGTYYITAVLDKSKEGARQTPTLLSVVTAVTQCYFWDSLNSMWKSSGCQVGLQSTLVRTQCLCNHLTYFGSDFFLVPRMVNVEDVAELFLRVTSNPVGVSLLASLVGIYMLIFVWAWRKDQADAQKVKVTILADNDPSSQFHYLIAVSTGYRRRAATTASVVITLYGSEGRSQPHHLCDSQKAVFERGGLDVFLLGTPSSLGELHSLRLWHDNSGASPAWYVSQVTVADIAVATRHPWNEFTRVQRLTCYMTLLLCNMVINVMFWKVNSTTTKRDEQARARCPSSLPGSRDKNNSIYVAPTMNTPVKRPERALKEKKFFKLTGDVLAQILFLTLLMTTVYSTQNSNRFYLRQAIHKSFSHRFSEIKLLKHFYTWANSTLLPNLYGDYRGFITDGNSFLLGNVLLRQIRVPCATFFSSRLSLQEQLKPSRQVQEDTENYGVNWGPPDKNSTKLDRIWHYQNQEALGGYPIQGEFATYSGGGYVVRLGRNSSNARRVLQQLEQSHWLDHCTKSLFVEFVVFNANVNLFCVVTLILESNNVGAFFTSMRLDILTSLQISKNFAWSVMSQVSYYLLVCYYAFAQGRQLKQQRWRFFMRKRNLLDMSIILLSFVILGLDLTVISLHKKHMVQYHYDRDRFINFYEAVKVNSAVIHLMGFLVLLATVQLWSLLYQNPRLQVIDRTLSKAWDEVVGFLLVILILLTGYAIAFNLLFGWSISDYQTFLSSAVTVVSFLMGISHHEEVTAVNPVLGSFLIFTYVVLMVLMIINLFVSAILMAFGKERKSLKQTERGATLMDMLLLKLSSLLGIQQHQSTCEHTALTATATDK
uniref:Polycystin 1 like 3, transient receptor potential channel interacting n=1 Tax=Ovis aries TaxID=9940 RepID=A0AC11D6C8_SHEEP